MILDQTLKFVLCPLFTEVVREGILSVNKVCRHSQTVQGKIN
uniref:Uncharacterized protein n=1 Tax=Arundo donax TaxID=35708 RepID=A0A0A9GHZ7_ARUDO